MVNDADAIDAHQIKETLEMYGLTALLRKVLEPEERSTGAEVHSQNSFFQYQKIANKELSRRQAYTGDTFTFPMWRKKSGKSFEWKKYATNNLEKWEEIEEYIEVPLMMFSGSCADRDIAFVGSIYDDFPDSGRKNPVNIRSEAIQLDSRILSIKASANSWNKEKEEFLDDECIPDPKLLYRKRLKLKLKTKSKEKSRRQLLFHENEIETSILRRHCAIWNLDIGLHGAWDIEDIETIEIDENGATCLTDKLGTYAIIAEKIEKPFDYDEGQFFKLKLAGYGFSNFILIIFIFIILLSAYVNQDDAND